MIDQAPARTASTRRLFATLLGLALLVAVVFGQVTGFSFLTFDDDLYVTDNRTVLRGLSWDGVVYAFSSTHASNWHPITWLSHMVDVSFFGTWAGGHHLVSAFSHLLNTLLLFFVLWRLTGAWWRSAFAAALFGVHPLHVESVAWIAERKDLLSTLFLLLTVEAYRRAVSASPGGPAGVCGRWGLSRGFLPVLLLFALGLMAKPMIVTLPFALLLLDVWPLRRVEISADGPVIRSILSALPRLLREKIPLFALSAASCVVTVFAQAGAVKSFDYAPLSTRFANAALSLMAYLSDTVWPSGLAPFYPYPSDGTVPVLQTVLALLLVAGISFAVVRQVRRRPYLAFGWLWFLGTLVPVLGLVQVGDASRADRYMYIPSIGLFVAVAWLLGEVVEHRPRLRNAVVALALASVVALAVVAWRQASLWRDGTTLFPHAISVTEGNWVAKNILGSTYGNLGRKEEAIGAYKEAIQSRRENWPAWNNLGTTYRNMGRTDDAIAAFREAVRIGPNNPVGWQNLGVSLDEAGRTAEAIAALSEAIKVRPGFAPAWNHLGVAYSEAGLHARAFECLKEAVRLDPESAETWNNFGGAYARLGRRNEAAEAFTEALRLQPDLVEARSNLAKVGGSTNVR